ncbi:unnamed protein product, partial [Symbiodinium necroappetens]
MELVRQCLFSRIFRRTSRDLHRGPHAGWARRLHVDADATSCQTCSPGQADAFPHVSRAEADGAGPFLWAPCPLLGDCAADVHHLYDWGSHA